MRLDLIVEARKISPSKLDPSQITAPTLHLNYPDADNTSKNPHILYLGTRHKLRRPGRSRVQKAKAITYVCGIRLDPQKHPRIIEILRHRIPDIYAQSGTKARVNRVEEILDAFGSGLFKELYGTYVLEPGMINKNGRKASDHKGITGSKRGADLTYLPLKQVAEIWKGEKLSPEQQEISTKFPKTFHPTLDPVKPSPKLFDPLHVPTTGPYQDPAPVVPVPEPSATPVVEPDLEVPPEDEPDESISAEPTVAPTPIVPVVVKPNLEVLSKQKQKQEKKTDGAKRNRNDKNIKNVKKFKPQIPESRTIGRAQSSQKIAQVGTSSSPSRQRRGSTSSPSRRTRRMA